MARPEPYRISLEYFQVLLTEISHIGDDTLHQLTFLFSSVDSNYLITIYRNFFTCILIYECLFVAVMITFQRLHQ